MSKIQKIRDRNNEIYIKYQTFCLCPSYSIFIDICNCSKIRNELETDFKSWYNAAIIKYNFENILNYEIEDIGNIKKLIVNSPTKSLLLKIWAIFFATGEYEYQKMCYIFCCHELISETLKEYAIKYILYVKEIYISEIDFLLSINKYWFDPKLLRHKLDMDVIKFKKIEKKIQKLEDE